MDFAGPFPASKSGKRYILVVVEFLWDWPMSRAAASATSQGGNKVSGIIFQLFR